MIIEVKGSGSRKLRLNPDHVVSVDGTQHGTVITMVNGEQLTIDVEVNSVVRQINGVSPSMRDHMDTTERSA